MPKLLIVDDDQETSEFLKEFFELRKCVVLTADSGKEALSLVREQNPDIILLDIRMDQMNGLEVLKSIKTYNKDIVVIMVTGLTDSETKQRAIELGADDFITKPVNEQILEGAVCLLGQKVTPKKERNTDGNDKDPDR